MSLLNEIRRSASRRILYTIHAVDEMNAPDEMIGTEEVREVIFEGEIIEEYTEDRRGHSCLLFKMAGNGKAIHVVCAPKEEYLAVITAYTPSLDRWLDDFKTRRAK